MSLHPSSPSVYSFSATSLHSLELRKCSVRDLRCLSCTIYCNLLQIEAALAVRGHDELDGAAALTFTRCYGDDVIK